MTQLAVMGMRCRAIGGTGGTIPHRVLELDVSRLWWSLYILFHGPGGAGNNLSGPWLAPMKQTRKVLMRAQVKGTQHERIQSSSGRFIND